MPRAVVWPGRKLVKHEHPSERLGPSIRISPVSIDILKRVAAAETSGTNSRALGSRIFRPAGSRCGAGVSRAGLRLPVAGGARAVCVGSAVRPAADSPQYAAPDLAA